LFIRPCSYLHTGLSHSRKVLVTFVCTITVWLHLACGLSRANADRLMKAIHLLILLAINFGRLLVKLQHPNLAVEMPLPTPLIPHDVHTAITTLSLNPKIIRSIWCSKCYAIYSLNHIPEICGRQETARSQPCGAKLWTTRSTRSGPRRVPCRLYSTRNFDSWLEFFLSRPGIEDLIDKSYDYNPSPNIMHTIWDSPAWQSLGSFTTTRANLTFAHYIDWFNPLLNKTVGKTVSCGAIMLIKCRGQRSGRQRCRECKVFGVDRGTIPQIQTCQVTIGYSRLCVLQFVGAVMQYGCGL